MSSPVQYSLNINSYKYPPQCTCPLEELEKYCRERLLLYLLFLEAEKKDLVIHTDEWAKHIKKQMLTTPVKTYMILLSENSDNDETFQAQQEDLISHWFLSLRYCTTQELRENFIKWEICWLTLLFKSSSTQKKKLFLKNHKFRYCKITAKEKEKLKENLLSCRSIINIAKFNKEPYYKTDFKNILGLVQKQEIYLSRGYAYFPESDMIHLIQCAMNAQIKEQLEWNIKMLPNVREDGRIEDLLQSLPAVITRSSSHEEVIITLDELEETAHENYPLCMKHIHEKLLSAHHLKHDCRMQYGIFLKNLGLSYEDAIQFFEQEFTKGMAKDLFNRKYAYYFKHYYGKVGGKLDYKPYSCEFIQSMTPTSGQHHGCPFKHWDKDILSIEIAHNGLSSANIKDIEDLVSEKSYQQACTMYFCATKRLIRDTVIESPNQYCADAIVLERNMNVLMDSICGTL